MRVLRIPLLVALSVAVVAACGKRTPGPSGTAPSASAPPAASSSAGVPELVPGKEVVLGLRLPSALKVTASFPGVTHATGEASTTDVARYVGERVTPARMELGTLGTVFPSTQIRGGDPGKTVRIEVNPRGAGTELVIRDITPLPTRAVDESVPEAERWKRAGLRPDGTPLDPMNLR